MMFVIICIFKVTILIALIIMVAIVMIVSRRCSGRIRESVVAVGVVAVVVAVVVALAVGAVVVVACRGVLVNDSNTHELNHS